MPPRRPLLPPPPSLPIDPDLPEERQRRRLAGARHWRRSIFLAVQAFRAQEPTPQKAADLYTNEASLKKLREAESQDLVRGGPRVPRLLQAGFIGVWDINDNGDVPPRMIIRGPETRSTGFAGVAFNPEAGEVYGVSGGLNGFLTYLVPQFFEQPRSTRTVAR